MTKRATAFILPFVVRTTQLYSCCSAPLLRFTSEARQGYDCAPVIWYGQPRLQQRHCWLFVDDQGDTYLCGQECRVELGRSLPGMDEASCGRVQKVEGSVWKMSSLWILWTFREDWYSLKALRLIDRGGLHQCHGTCRYGELACFQFPLCSGSYESLSCCRTYGDCRR